MIINDYKTIPDNDVYYSDTVVLVKPLHDDIVNKELGGMKLEYIVKRGVFLGPKLYALVHFDKKIGKDNTILKVRGLHEPNVTFEDMLTLLDNKVIKASHIIWRRNLANGTITLKDQVFRIAAS